MDFTATTIAPRLRYQVALLTVNRTVMNTGFRMVYPLLPVFARGVGVEIGAIATILTFTQLIGLLAPVMGIIAERRSKRFNIVLGLAVNTIGLSMVFLIPGYAGLAVALILAAVGKNTLYDPAVQAYVGDRVPYQRRGLVMAIIEFSWSLAFLIGVPLMTWLIDLYDWRAPFAVVAALTGIGTVLLLVLLDVDETQKRKGTSFFGDIRAAIATRTAIYGLILGLGISTGNQLITIVFGVWIEVSFGIALTALAAASAVIGGSELLGEGIVARFADSFGKQTLIAIGIIINIVASALLPMTGGALWMALTMLFVFYLGFEISLVATIPLASELAPAKRGMYMTLLVASFTLGRAIITQPSAWIFEAYGLWANAGLAIALNLMALYAVIWGIQLKHGSEA
jgi:predicted MFS family arabinose efflux permease